ncbi:hypothetical protein KC343_g22945, partial [Hortaea werneckii]
MSSKETTSSSPTKPAPPTNTKSNRLPAPSLFVGPPSHNASQLSVSRTGGGEGKTAREPLMRTKSKLGESNTHDHSKDANTTGTTAFPTLRKASEKSVDGK